MWTEYERERVSDVLCDQHRFSPERIKEAKRIYLENTGIEWGMRGGVVRAARNPYSLKWWLVRKLTGGSIEVASGREVFIVTLTPSGRENTLRRKGMRW